MAFGSRRECQACRNDLCFPFEESSKISALSIRQPHMITAKNIWIPNSTTNYTAPILLQLLFMVFLKSTRQTSHSDLSQVPLVHLLISFLNTVPAFYHLIRTANIPWNPVKTLLPKCPYYLVSSMLMLENTLSY